MQPRFVFDFPAANGNRQPLAFGAPGEVLQATRHDDVRAVLCQAEARARAGAWVAGFVSYEAAPAFDTALKVHACGPLPLAWFGVFESPLPAVPAGEQTVTEVGSWRPSIDRERFADDIATIRSAIFDGDVYQVNHTLRLAGSYHGDPYAWFCHLHSAQPQGYCAYLDIGQERILSMSPELFFRRDGDRLTTKPMKGTAKRGRWLEEDSSQAEWLATSAKNRAENLMIVDLLRNDLARVATLYSVKVPALFSVETYPTLLQMTSTVTAHARPDTKLDDLFAALFPCGSITGAPKAKAMEIITRLETTPRGVYCGAIGLLHPGGDAVFNVGIRSVVVNSAGQMVCGLGSGVTWDSSAADEYEEVLLKSRFLHAEASDFGLIETLHLKNGHYARLEKHLERLAGSSHYFDFAFDQAACRAELSAIATRADGEFRVRIEVRRNGQMRFESASSPSAARQGGRFALATKPVDSASLWLYHKTTRRDFHEQARAARPDVFEVLLWNERRELTEFTRGNLVLEIDGRRLTPSRGSGLLAGCRRAELLATGEIAEAVLHIEDLARAHRVWFINSLRGEVELTPPIPLGHPA